MSTIYTPAHINSEIFERLRSSKYTPSVSHSLDSSLREGAGKRPHNVNHPPAGYLVSGRVIFGLCVGGDILPFIGVLAKPWGCGRFSSPLRNSEILTLYHSSKDTPSVSHSLDSSLREGAGNGVRTTHRTARKIQRCGRFSSPLRKAQKILPFAVQRKITGLTESGEWGMIIANI